MQQQARNSRRHIVSVEQHHPHPLTPRSGVSLCRLGVPGLPGNLCCTECIYSTIDWLNAEGIAADLHHGGICQAFNSDSFL
jgi:hypothetical protein